MKVLSAIAFVILSSIVSGQRLIPVLTDYSALMDGEGSTGVYFDAIEYDGRLFFGGKPSSIEDQTFNGGVVVWDGSTFGDFSSELDMFYVQWELEGKHDFVKCRSAIDAIEWINNQ